MVILASLEDPPPKLKSGNNPFHHDELFAITKLKITRLNISHHLCAIIVMSQTHGCISSLSGAYQYQQELAIGLSLVGAYVQAALDSSDHP